MNINLKQIKTIKRNEGALCVIKFLWAKLINQFLFKIPSLRLNNKYNIFCVSANRAIKTQFSNEFKLIVNLLSNFGLGVKSPSFGN